MHISVHVVAPEHTAMHAEIMYSPKACIFNSIYIVEDFLHTSR